MLLDLSTMDRFSSLAGDNNDHTPSPAKKQKLVAESSKLGRKPSLRKPILSPRSGIERTKQQHCHYCTGALKGDDYVRCTKLTKSRPGSRLEPCEKAYCQRHLAKVYGTSVSEARAAVFDPSLAEEHAADQGYVWTCFHCRGLCVGKHCVRRRIHIGQTKPVPSTSYSPPSALRSATTENTAKSVFPAAGHVSNPIPDPTIAASHHRHSTAPQFLITPRAERSIGPKYDPQATGSLELAGHKDRHGSRPPLPDTSTALERNGSGSKAAATTQRNCSNMPCPAFDTHESCASATDLPSSDLSAPHGTLNADIPVPARDESMTPLPGSYLHPLSLILDRQRVSLPSRESSLVASNRPVMLMPMPHAAPSALGRHDPVTPFTMPQQGPRASDRGTSAAARHVLPKSGRHESETQHSDLTRQPPLGISISGWGRPLPTTRPITIPPPLYIPYHPTILRPLTIHDQIRPSHDFGFGSELGFSGPVDMMAERFAQVGSNAKRKSVGLREKLADVQAKIQAQALRKKKDSIATNGSKTKEAAKPVQAGTGKDKSKDAEGKAKIPRAKPVPKPEVPVDPPIFEKVDTRLGREGAEYRLMFREYMVRFQAVLAIPDRSLPPLDDFDRPLSEASMRIFVGAMLGLIKEELEADNGDEDVLELLSRHREELRYHGDFARFANTFKVLTKPLGLRMPLALPTTGVAANTQAVRDLLGLNEDGNPPADEPTHRSVTSGRIPSQHEVVRMLLALAERTISTPKIRRDLMWEAPENEARRTHQQQVKRENHRHEDVNKALAEARVVCKSPSAMIANTKETEQENLEHVMQLSLADVNLRAALGLRALRQGPLGVDLDGRIYYCLQHRSVDDDSRPPDAWASDLLVWGIGVPSKPGTNADEDELPVFTERWCHFGKSSEVEQLVKWIEYRLRVALRAAQSPKTPTKATSKPATPQTLKSVRATKPSTPRGVDKTPITPALIKTSKNVQPVTPTDRTVNAKTTPKAVPNVFPRWVTSTPKQTTPKSGTTPRTTLEVVIPLRPRDGNLTVEGINKHSPDLDHEEIHVDDANDDRSDSVSELSALSSDTDGSDSALSSDTDESESDHYDTKELLGQLAPEGYVPSMETVQEEGRMLVRRLMSVAEWLAVLEWKGMGEA